MNTSQNTSGITRPEHYKLAGMHGHIVITLDSDHPHVQEHGERVFAKYDKPEQRAHTRLEHLRTERPNYLHEAHLRRMCRL